MQWIGVFLLGFGLGGLLGNNWRKLWPDDNDPEQRWPIVKKQRKSDIDKIIARVSMRDHC